MITIPEPPLPPLGLPPPPPPPVFTTPGSPKLVTCGPPESANNLAVCGPRTEM